MKRTVLFIIALSLLSSCGLFDDQSKPDITTKAPLEDALDWISKQ